MLLLSKKKKYKRQGKEREESRYDIVGWDGTSQPLTPTNITDAYHPMLLSFIFFPFISLSLTIHNSPFPFSFTSSYILSTLLHYLQLGARAMTTTPELLQIEPGELIFVFELKKQSSCLIQLGNKADQYVAFKVKTTSPKKYCVRPNLGIIKPNDTRDFTVTMQAQRTAPPDLQCKDKFLIQCTVVPFGATEDDITSDMFSKDSGKYIEEKKLKVVLISPSSSPVLLPVNGDMKQDISNEIHVQKDRVPGGVENIPPPLRVSEEFKGFEMANDMEEDRTDEDIVTRHAENVGDIKPAKDDVQLNLANDSEELKSRLTLMDSKLREAEVTMMKLNEERRMNTQEKDLLKKELEVLKRKIDAKRVQAGFPLLFVCMVALVSVAIGYYIHP